MRGILEAAIYVPRWRLETANISETWGQSTAKGIDEKAVPAADEDTLTMAIEAVERLFSNSTADRNDVDHVAVATTTPPLAESDLVAKLRTATGLPANVRTATLTQHTASGAEALATAIDRDGLSLVVCSDCPVGIPATTDHPLGAGAAAMLIGEDARTAVSSVGWYSLDAPGIRFRTADSVQSLGITNYERETIITAVTAAMENTTTDRSIDYAVLHQPNGTLPYRIARSVSIDTEKLTHGIVSRTIGDVGTATVAIGLLKALSEATTGEDTLAVFYGGGTAAAFNCTGSLNVSGLLDFDETESLTYATYLRQRGYLGTEQITGGGANVSLPTWQRSLDSRYRLVAGRCPLCDSISFPPDGACQTCHERVSFEHVPAEREGTIVAASVIGHGGAPPEFTTYQQRSGRYAAVIVELPVGDQSVRVPAQLTDIDTDEVAIEIGDTVRSTIRRIYEQEGVVRYGVKFTPNMKNRQTD